MADLTLLHHKTGLKQSKLQWWYDEKFEQTSADLICVARGALTRQMRAGEAGKPVEINT